ncbi:MAG: hypothetical protein HOE90_08160 [Bacteriovoracaceae bacterium]|jgi:uncharacterized protein RhaS with RHS repeats|nr:hypothetical protein [Bacteriovoracaceae bacterium]
MKIKNVGYIILSLLLSIPAIGGVNLKNGNFYISYTDIVVPGGANSLKITRTYNSKSTHEGWFGFGWGSDFETYLKPQADGSVVVFENGGGATTRFTPKAAVDPKKAAQKIVDAMRKRSAIAAKAANDLVVKLTKDAELRLLYGKKFNVESSIANGSTLYSNNRGIQELSVAKAGYVRKYTDGKKHHFNKLGKLIKITEKNGYYTKFTYEKTGLLKNIKDSQAKQLFFSWYPNKRAKEIWSGGDKKAFYKYSGKDLSYSKDISGNIYTYTYDKIHNLSGIVYTDKSKMAITYDKKTQFVTSVTTKNGDKTSYKYGANPKDPKNHYWTSVTKKGFNGKPVTNKYEYEIRTKPDGERYTYRIATNINSVNTETIYSECCSLPLKIARGKHITNFDYDESGLLLKKTSTKGDFIKLEYNNKIKKIAKVTDNKGWTKFNYDKKGNLTKALNSKGQAVLLVYDRKGKITKMVDTYKSSKKKRILSFKYNSMGKPVEITMSKVGKINVAYDNYGEIKKVESKAGNKMALQVTQAFQNLLSIVKPAGVSLNF